MGKTGWLPCPLRLFVLLQLCVRLCEAYKQQYISLRDAMKLDNPEKVRRLPYSQHHSCCLGTRLQLGTA